MYESAIGVTRWGFARRKIERLARFFFPVADLDEALAGRVRAQQVAAVRRLVPITMPANIANGAVLLHQVSDTPLAAAVSVWFLILLLISLGTLRRWHRSRRRPKRASCPPSLIQRAVVQASALGLLWGTATILTFPAADGADKVLLTCLFSGMLSGGVFALTPIPQAALAYIGVFLPAGIFALLTSAEGPFVAPSLLLLVFSAMLAGSAIWHSRLFVQNLLSQAKLESIGGVDGLTNLANRARFALLLDNACRPLGEAPPRVALLILDLDRFKLVNHIHGYALGDLMLAVVATRLERMVGAGGTVGRLAGDQFAVLLREPGETEALRRLASQLIDAVNAPTIIDGARICIGASIGIARAPEDGSDADALTRCATLALRRAKSLGVPTCFDPSMDAALRARQALERELSTAIGNGEMRLHFQPIVAAATGRIAGCEALVRWSHPREGLMAAGRFIPLAEESGLIVELGAWVLRQACRTAAQWPADIYVAVNLSPIQLRNGDIVAVVEDSLRDSGLAPRRLLLEITESVFIDDTEAALATLLRLRALGVGTALDDFGTGYSSLGYLRHFRFDKLKIDRSFVSGMVASQESKDIVRAIIALSCSFGMTTVAEGVERPEEVAQLCAEGCCELQGYLLGRPVADTDLPSLFERSVLLTPATAAAGGRGTTADLAAPAATG